MDTAATYVNSTNMSLICLAAKRKQVKNYKKKKCINCNELFQPKSTSQKYCEEIKCQEERRIARNKWFKSYRKQDSIKEKYRDGTYKQDLVSKKHQYRSVEREYERKKTIIYERECLRCDRKFKTKNKFNRLCCKCIEFIGRIPILLPDDFSNGINVFKTLRGE